MQVSKSFSGTLSDVGTGGNRQGSYGSTSMISTHPNKVDFFNQTIADFLHDECGVDATYEIRDGSTYKFLWIYGAPFLFAVAGSTANHFSFHGPYSTVTLNSGSATKGGVNAEMILQENAEQIM